MDETGKCITVAVYAGSNYGGKHKDKYKFEYCDKIWEFLLMQRVKIINEDKILDNIVHTGISSYVAEDSEMKDIIKRIEASMLAYAFCDDDIMRVAIYSGIKHGDLIATFDELHHPWIRKTSYPKKELKQIRGLKEPRRRRML